MATPTNSILYYLQCIGRVVRTPEDYSNARAHVIEIIDRLPNVSYRIDNRWLFAEISDFLEPKIEDIRGIWPINSIRIFKKLISYKIKFSDISRRDTLNLIFGKRINLLLFNDVPESSIGKWRVFVIKEGDYKKIQMR